MGIFRNTYVKLLVWHTRFINLIIWRNLLNECILLAFFLFLNELCVVCVLLLLIGQISVGQVRVCREKTTDHVYAMKKLKKSEMLRRGQVCLSLLFFCLPLFQIVLVCRLYTLCNFIGKFTFVFSRGLYVGGSFVRGSRLMVLLLVLCVCVCTRMHENVHYCRHNWLLNVCFLVLSLEI